jgi:hypothetical protein
VQLDSLKEFYNSLDSIALIDNKIDNSKDRLKNYVDSFNNYVQTLEIKKSKKFKSKEIDNLLNSSLESIKKSTQNWVKDFKDLLQRTKFRDELESYFIVIIFGKVKAGKSSLGNFIAENRLEHQSIKFFKYDVAGREQEIAKLEEIQDDEEQNGFKTNNLECTVEIQGFKLSRLAWIDTPGLGSMTPENGKLAKKYIEAADYIIYPTSSDSPLQKDEQEQIKELFEQNKKVTVCITKSDKYEEDECECGSEYGCDKCDDGIIKVLVNKSKEDRKKQEKWVKNELSKIIDSSKESLIGDIISISVHTAKKGLESGDEKLFKESNIERFYDLMTDVIKNDASRFKGSTPYNGLISFINGILQSDKNSLKSIISKLDSLKRRIQESEEKILKFKKSIEIDINNILFDVVRDSEITVNNSKRKFQEFDRAIQEEVMKLIDRNLREAFDNVSKEIENLNLSLNTDNFRVKKRYKTIKERYKDNSIWNLWGLLGDNYKTVTKTIEIGDNKLDIIQEYKSSRKRYFMNEISKKYEIAEDEFFTPLKNFIKDVDSKILELKSSLQSLSNELKK